MPEPAGCSEDDRSKVLTDAAIDYYRLTPKVMAIDMAGGRKFGLRTCH